jgi:hypothetical protein
MFTKEEFLEVVREINQDMNRERRRSDWKEMKK